MLYLGCPMWGLKSWTGSFFPKGAKQREFLALYSRRLNAVEGNTTFYALPDEATVDRWREETPTGFKFCFKFPQVISHRRRLKNAEAETRDFLARLERLGERGGPAFLQLPPTFSGAQLPVLAAYLAALPRDFRYAVEPRHADYFGKDEAALDAVLREHAIARVGFDTRPVFSLPQGHSQRVAAAQRRKPNQPVRRTRTASFAFVRYVGHPDLAANGPWLTEWAEAVAEWLRLGDDVFFFLHNPDDAYSPQEARMFHALVRERHRLPPLPDWASAPPPAQQASLF